MLCFYALYKSTIDIDIDIGYLFIRYNQFFTDICLVMLAQYYNFTLFAMMLNELNDQLTSTLPPTDSRLRPDIRKMENGDIGKSV